MKLPQFPRFPLDLAELRRTLTDLFRSVAQIVNELVDWKTLSTSSTSVTGNTTMTGGTYVVTASGKTMTLPSAASATTDVTVILAVSGWVDVSRGGSDTITVDGGVNTIRLDNPGASVTLRAITSTSWGLA